MRHGENDVKVGEKVERREGGDGWKYEIALLLLLTVAYTTGRGRIRCRMGRMWLLRKRE